MFAAPLQSMLQQQPAPVALLEGTRKLPSAQRQALVNIGCRLAGEYPGVLFRSGNAAGADEAFATGVARVPGARLQLILPSPGMGRARRPTGPVLLPAGVAGVRVPAARGDLHRRHTGEPPHL